MKLSRPCLYPILPNDNVGIANWASNVICAAFLPAWLVGCATAVRIYPNKRAIYTQVPPYRTPGGGQA